MKKIISSLFLLLLCFTASAQMQEPVKFSVTQKTLSDTEFEIVFTGKVEAGWHVYSTDIPDGGPTPAAIIFDQIKGVEPVGKLKPAGKVVKQFDNLFEMEVSYMEGQATFIQKMRITGADYSVKGILTYGACNDENCIPPSEVGFSFSGKGKAGSAAEDKDMKEQEEVEEVAAVSDTLKADSVVATAVADSVPASVAGSDYWAPVIDELAAYGESASNAVSQAWWKIFLLGFLGGLVALLTPCVWPIIPMTVSFFLKRSGDKVYVTHLLMVSVL